MSQIDLYIALRNIGIKLYTVFGEPDGETIDITCKIKDLQKLKAAERGFFNLEPRKILKSGNRTIVFWQDGTKTIVKRAEDEAESDYNAFTAALGIKCFGSNSALKRIVERTETQKPKCGHSEM